MKFTNRLATLFIVTLSTVSVKAQVLIPTQATDKVLLNGSWKFKYIESTDIGADSSFYRPDVNVSNWGNIKTPGNWELQGFAEPFYGKNLKAGTGLYRTVFNVPANWKERPVYIAFDGVQYGYEL